VTSYGAECAAIVRAARPGDYRVGLVLGSGLGDFASEVEDAARIPFQRLTGFPASGVSGHRGEVVVGKLSGVDVVVLAGRAHYYESGDAAVMRTPVEMMRELGCSTLILTNAAGSLREDLAPGELMLIGDHINFSGSHPLIGEHDDRRFVNLVDAYDPSLRAGLSGAAAEEGISMGEGVYMWFSGPAFETPAEIRMARLLGADAVGMSTVPEVILARFFGLRVAAVSTITNYGAGMGGGAISHEETKAVAPLGAVKLVKIIRRFLADMPAV
jgi:purine-nucleoside phosphorylase